MVSSLKHVPVVRPRPNASHFRDVIVGRAKSPRVPLIEYLIDDLVARPIVENMLGRQWVPWSQEHDAMVANLDNRIALWQGLGYDILRIELPLPFDLNYILHDDTAPGATGKRVWVDEHTGRIASWEDFESYPWPRVEEFNFFPFEYLDKHLPEGMGLLVSHAGGPFETLSTLMSFEGLCIALYQQRDLVEAVARRTGELMESFYRHLLGLERLVALFPGDDMGFRTGTLVSPDDLRRLILPWHRRFAAMAHERGVLYLLHSCGNVESIMGDLIDDVGIDGKHSFEDAIIPPEEFQRRYGERIAVLGGMDVDRLTSGTPEQVRARTRELIAVCGARGRFALGSGNSVPSYVPLENFLAMLDEALDCMSSAA